MPVVPYKEQSASKKAQVRDMFNNIAPKYDLLNRVLSAGIDILWRKKAVSLLKPHRPKYILDVATGTADFAIECLSLKPDKIIGVDISEAMLDVGRKKLLEKQLPTIELRTGDSEKLDFETNTFDAVTVAFGVRNFENLEKGLSDILRVLKPGGHVVILEFSKPKKFPIKYIYNLYFTVILPTVGRWVSKDKAAYTYLPESVNQFPEGETFLAILAKTGFNNLKCVPLTFGISSIYFGSKSA